MWVSPSPHFYHVLSNCLYIRGEKERLHGTAEGRFFLLELDRLRLSSSVERLLEPRTGERGLDGSEGMKGDGWGHGV